MRVLGLGLNLYLAEAEREKNKLCVHFFFLYCFQGQPGVMGMEGQPGLPGYTVSSSVGYHATPSLAFPQAQAQTLAYQSPSFLRRAKTIWAFQAPSAKLRSLRRS